MRSTAGGSSASAAGAAPPGPEPDASVTRDLVAYGALGLPLAFAALPIYVHVPRLYTDGLGLSLAVVGAVLLAARIVDAVTDPLIGWANDRLPRRRGWIALALPALGAGMVGLLVPPAGAGAAWLFALLVAVSLAYSVATIAYNAWGAEVATTPDARTRFVASREGFALGGVVLAAALPGVLAMGEGEAAGLARLAWVFLPLLLVFGVWTLWRAPPPPRVASLRAPVWAGLRSALRQPAFARLLAVFAANGIAAAIPSATVLFFVADVLEAAHLAGLFLVLYFLAAAASLPLWVRASQRIGKLRAWLAGMVLAVAVFAWAGLLGSGDVFAYAAICVLSGLALGADLSLPPSLLADLIAQGRDGERRAPLEAGACFGWWNFVTKANLALAAGLALPLLALLGYAPGARDAAAVAALAGVYGFVPLVLKLAAIVLLWRWRCVIEPGHSRLGAAQCAATTRGIES
ncbi:MAG: MFS transporter [Thauera sp.]